MKLTESFYSDVGRVYDSEFQLPPKAFFEQLTFALENDSYEDASLEDLRVLEKTLKTWSSECDRALKKQLRSLEKDDPVKCPVSLFGTMDCGRLEIAHTRTLAWLLNPRGEHGFGSRMIESLVHHLHKGKRPQFRVETVKAEQFYDNPDDEDAGRTDVWIKGVLDEKPWLLVIEAKVDSPEGDQQLGRYDKEIQRWRKQWPSSNVHVDRIFLTPDRTDPSSQNWTKLSFSELTRIFWEAAGSLKTRPGYHFLRFYIAGILKDVLDMPIGKISHQLNRFRLLGFLQQPPNTSTSTRSL
jgi:hypothetical protein